jgi:DNA polymerase
MALHDSALEELGLAPMWVRRGMGQAAAPAGQAAGALSEAVEAAAPGAAARGAVIARQDTPSPESGAREPAAAARSREAPAPRNDEAGEAPTRESRPSTQPASADTDDLAWFDDLSNAAPAPARIDRTERVESAGPPIATLDWGALSARVASCEMCRLCEKRTNTVFGVGDRNADWMLIGEAPGENEDRQGEPFVGQAGKLLDNMLGALTLARTTNVYIANVIKCRPPGNRNPEPDEVARCEPYLQRQVALVKPKLIVALGRFAAQSLLKTDASISSLRGRVHEYEGVPVIVTYHPAYLLRSLPDKAKAWADLCLARDTWRRAAGGPAS